MSDRKYCGSGKKVKDYDLFNISIELTNITKSDIYESESGRRYLNVSMGQRRSPDNYGNTHSVWVNDFVKDHGG